MNDWTAAHELSHLLLPYLGRDNSWYAEGFASFMQYQILHAMNLLSKSAIDTEYQRRLDKAESNYTFDQLPFALAAKKLRAQHKYPTMYWGFSEGRSSIKSQRRLPAKNTARLYQMLSSEFIRP